MLRRVGILLLCLSLSPLPVLADTRYVATGGSDSNPGTASAPFRTIARSLQGAGGGDIVLIGPGVYQEGNLAPASGVTLRAADAGNRPILRPGGGDTIVMITEGKTGITLDGLRLDGSDGGSGHRVQFPLYADGPGIRNITLTNAEVLRGMASCLLLEGVGWTITRNHIHHCGLDTTYDHGIYFMGSESLIANNLFEHNAGYNIQNYTDPTSWGKHGYGLPERNTYDSNVFRSSGLGVTLTWGGGHVFRKNVMVDDATGPGGVGLLGFGTNTVVEGNTLVNNSILTLGSADVGARITGNTVCRGTIQAQHAHVSDNRLTCDGLNVEALIQERLAATPVALGGGGRPVLPAPKNLRVFVVP